MLKPLVHFRDNSCIFTGYKIPWNRLPTVTQHINPLIGVDCVHHSIGSEGYLVGKILVFTDNGTVSFSMDSIREYSVCDEVREVQRVLLELFPEEYRNEFPKLYLVRE